MKWLKEVYDLFVDDPILALVALVALAIALVLAKVGIRQVAGLAIFLVVGAGLWYSTSHD